MPTRALFAISIAVSLLAWGFVAAKYYWPWLVARSRADALRPLIVLHAFRFVGLAFVVPGVVSPNLPIEFARPAAYGDLTTATLALASLPLLHRGIGILLVWVLNVVGTTDLLYAFYQGNQTAMEPGLMGAAYFIPTVLVPALLIAHVLAFLILLRMK